MERSVDGKSDTDFTIATDHPVLRNLRTGTKAEVNKITYELEELHCLSHEHVLVCTLSRTRDPT